MSQRYPFVRYSTEGTWIAYSERDQNGQQQVHIISAPTGAVARKVLRAQEGDRAQDYQIRAISDAVALTWFSHNYNPRVHALTFTGESE